MIPVLMQTETEQRTVDGVTTRVAADGWVLDYSGQLDSLKDKSFSVRCIDYKAVKREISEQWTLQQCVRFVRTLTARDAIKSGDWSAVLKAYGLNASERMTDVERSAKATKVQLKTTSEISKRLRRARVVMWARQEPGRGGWMKTLMGVGLLCPDLTTAAFVLEALDKLRACPRCGELFQPSRPQQKYCSDRCRDTFNKRQQRQKSKAEGAKNVSL